MKTILAATDLSPASHAATYHATQLAKALGARVHLVNVYNDPLPPGTESGAWVVLVGTREREQEVVMRQELKRLRTDAAIEVDGRIAGGGTESSIIDEAKKVGADLIVIGRKKEKSNLFGSTATHLLRKTETPVLLVPEGLVYQPPKHIVLAVDFLELVSPQTIAALRNIVSVFDASLQVIHIDKKGGDLNSGETAAKLQLGEALASLDYFYDRIESDDVERGILDFAASHPCELLVMIHHPHGLLHEMFRARHTKTISEEIAVPLLVLRGG
ncbi:universal stress protein [Flaviaesturariibacter terrae]